MAYYYNNKFLLTVLLITVHIVIVSSTFVDLLFSDSNIKEFKQGGGKEYNTEGFTSHGEKGNKGYLSQHQNKNAAKGFHDKERQKKGYAEEGGRKSGYAHDDGYYNQQQKAVKGGKGFHFEDKGSYAKGHSTKGHHNIHKLDEYKKNIDFYDKDHDEAFKENHGGYEVEKGAKAGVDKAGGFINAGYFGKNFGISGQFDNGLFYFDENGHLRVKGRDGYYSKGAEYANKGENGDFKDYGYLISHK